MRKVLFGSLTALAVMGCGQVDAPIPPLRTGDQAPVSAPSRYELIGNFKSKVTPAPDGLSAQFETVTIATDGSQETNPAQTIELYSDGVLNTSNGHGCGGTDLYAQVIVKSYYQDQLRNVAVELTNISDLNHGHCNAGSPPAGLSGTLGNFGFYNYPTLDPLSQASMPWAFNFVVSTDFWITYKVYAVLWPSAGTIAAPMNGDNYEVPYIWVDQAEDGVTLLSRLYTDAALTQPVVNSDISSFLGDGTGWDVYPNGDNWANPVSQLVDGTVYYVGVFSQGQDNGSPSQTITGSRYATDSFRYARNVSGVFPLGTGTSAGQFLNLHAGSSETLKWTSSIGSTSSRFTIYACSGSGCPNRGTAVAAYTDVTVSGRGNLSSSPITGLADKQYYRWSVSQYFGAEFGGQTSDLIFRYLTVSHPAGAADPTWP
jgi:hypothetical protein